MVTVDIPELKLQPQSVVLDAGCGTGRHLRELAKIQSVKIIGIDTNEKELNDAYLSLQEMSDAATNDFSVMKADINKLPFPDEAFDCVICSEVLEHIPQHYDALQELVRVLKPQGKLIISVPRYYPERICWLISPAYHNAEGGHIRIYTKKGLRKMLMKYGIKCWKINYKHALHAPYWWLKCLVGLKNEENWFVRNYKKFLEWDIMQKPFFTRMLEELLNPVLGKSIVLYCEGPIPKAKPGGCRAQHVGIGNLNNPVKRLCCNSLLCHSVQARRDFEPAPCLTRGNPVISITSGYRLLCPLGYSPV